MMSTAFIRPAFAGVYKVVVKNLPKDRSDFETQFPNNKDGNFPFFVTENSPTAQKIHTLLSAHPRSQSTESHIKNPLGQYSRWLTSRVFNKKGLVLSVDKRGDHWEPFKENLFSDEYLKKGNAKEFAEAWFSENKTFQNLRRLAKTPHGQVTIDGETVTLKVYSKVGRFFRNIWQAIQDIFKGDADWLDIPLSLGLDDVIDAIF